MKTSRVIGTKIQNIRASKQLTIEDVCERSGLSREQVEEIENNEDVPSLAPLIKIARALGVRLGTFLDDETGREPVVCRKNDRDDAKSVYFCDQETVERHPIQYHLLAENKADRHMEPFLIDLAPSKEADNFKFLSHEGEEFLYVLQGSVEVRYGKSTYFLGEKDSIYYDAIVTHYVHPVADTNAKVLAIIYESY